MGDKNEEDECSICLDSLHENVVTTVCKHTFHKECVGRWVKDVRRCPYCAREFTLSEAVIDNPGFYYERSQNPEEQSSIFDNTVSDFYRHEAALLEFYEARTRYLVERQRRIDCLNKVISSRRHAERTPGEIKIFPVRMITSERPRVRRNRRRWKS